jgi:hypothetical protein
MEHLSPAPFQADKMPPNNYRLNTSTTQRNRCGHSGDGTPDRLHDGGGRLVVMT